MAIPFMDSDNDIIEFDGLIYERTDDMSVLSDFRCGIYDMDAFAQQESVKCFRLYRC